MRARFPTVLRILECDSCLIQKYGCVVFRNTGALIKIREATLKIKDSQGEVYTLKAQMPMQTNERAGSFKSEPGAAEDIIRQHIGKHAHWTRLHDSIAARVRLHRNVSQATLGAFSNLLTRVRKKERNPWLFLPESRFIAAWDVLSAVVLSYVAIWYPYETAFRLRSAVGSAWFIVDASVDTWFILDMFVTFRRAFMYRKGPKLGSIEMQPKVLAIHYLKGWFGVDFIACLPAHYIFLAVDGGIRASTWFEITRCFRLVRLLKLAHVGRVVANYEDTSLHDYVESCKVMLTGLSMLWLSHLMACIWYASGTFSQSFGNQTVLGWVHYDFREYDADFLTRGRQYLVAYHAVNPKMFDMNDSHSGDFTDFMLLMAILLEIGGVVIFGILVSQVSTHMASGNIGKQRYRDAMESLKSFFRVEDIPFSTRRKVRAFYNKLYTHKSAIDLKQILEPLPPLLLQEVMFTMYGDIIRQNKLFERLDDHIVTQLCLTMKPIHVSEGTVVIREGDTGQEMYLLLHGELAVSSGSKHVDTMRKGACFGERALISSGIGDGGGYRAYTITALTNCDLCFLTRSMIRPVSLPLLTTAT